MAEQKPKNPKKHSTYLQTEKKSSKPFHDTPMIDQLESGPWPSFVTGLKRIAMDNNMMVDLLGQLEHSYKTRLGYWKGGTVSVFGYGGGIIPRFTELMGEDGKAMFPEAKEFHTVRVQPPAGNHYTTGMLRSVPLPIMFNPSLMKSMDTVGISAVLDLASVLACLALVQHVANNPAPMSKRFTAYWSIISSMICIAPPCLTNSNSKYPVALMTA